MSNCLEDFRCTDLSLDDLAFDADPLRIRLDAVPGLAALHRHLERMYPALKRRQLALRGRGSNHAGRMSDDLPTARSTLRAGFRVHVWCKACRHAKDADQAALIAAGRGDVLLIETR